MNPSRRIRVESLVFLDKARPAIVSKARFAGVQEGDHVWVVLDAGGTELPRKRVRLEIPAQDVAKIAESQCEATYQNIGPPIELWDYASLPQERHGFEILG
jgi:hypothetical protein